MLGASCCLTNIFSVNDFVSAYGAVSLLNVRLTRPVEEERHEELSHLKDSGCESMRKKGPAVFSHVPLLLD